MLKHKKKKMLWLFNVFQYEKLFQQKCHTHNRKTSKTFFPTAKNTLSKNDEPKSIISKVLLTNILHKSFLTGTGTIIWYSLALFVLLFTEATTRRVL